MAPTLNPAPTSTHEMTAAVHMFTLTSISYQFFSSSSGFRPDPLLRPDEEDHFPHVLLFSLPGELVPRLRGETLPLFSSGDLRWLLPLTANDGEDGAEQMILPIGLY